MHIDNGLSAFSFRRVFDPAKIVASVPRFAARRVMSRAIPASRREFVTRTIPVTRNAFIGQKRTMTRAQVMRTKSGAGLAGLWDVVGNLATTAVTYKMTALNTSRAEADARLIAAKQAAAEHEAQRAMTQQAAAQPKRSLPIMPLAIGGIALAGAAFFLLKKKR